MLVVLTKLRCRLSVKACYYPVNERSSSSQKSCEVVFSVKVCTNPVNEPVGCAERKLSRKRIHESYKCLVHLSLTLCQSESDVSKVRVEKFFYLCNLLVVVANKSGVEMELTPC